MSNNEKKIEEPSIAYGKEKQEVITRFDQLDLDKLYTYDEYMTWQFTERVELIKGKIFKMFAAPTRIHQRILVRLIFNFEDYFDKGACEVYAAPFDVRFPNGKNDKNTYTVVQPDICIICDLEKLDEKGCNGAPDLIIEILSPSTSAKDTTHKFELYQEHGVKEYWMVDPSNKLVDVFLLDEGGKYRLDKKYNREETIAVNLFPGLEIDLKKVFEEIIQK